MQVSERNILPLCAMLGRAQLAGAAAGRAVAPRLKAAASNLAPPWVVDFSNIELITASAFREALLCIVDQAAHEGYPCFLAQVDEITRDEALIAAAQAGRVLLFCDLILNSQLRNATVVGPLDAKLTTALKLVLQLREADAKSVSDASGEDSVTTVWNNRLVALTRMGLLAERKVGKTKYYSPVIEDMSYGK